MNKKGYISIELVIVAGLVLVFGLYAVSRFVKQGQSAADAQEGALTEVFSTINNTTRGGAVA